MIKRAVHWNDIVMLLNAALANGAVNCRSSKAHTTLSKRNVSYSTHSSNFYELKWNLIGFALNSHKSQISDSIKVIVAVPKLRRGQGADAFPR